VRVSERSRASASAVTFWGYSSAISGCRSGGGSSDLGLALVHRDLVVQHQVQELLDPRADPLDLAFSGGQADAALHPEPVHLASELVAELFEQILLKQLLLERVEHSRFNLVAPNGQVVVAPSLVTSTEASEPVLARHDESSAADAALRQSGEQVLRPLHCAERASGFHRVACLLLPCLRATQRSSGTMRSAGTSFRIHSASGLRRDTRFPVSGFFT
jgi:hypothetical protein